MAPATNGSSNDSSDGRAVENPTKPSKAEGPDLLEGMDQWTVDHLAALDAMLEVDWSDATCVAATHRELEGTFWGAAMSARRLASREHTKAQPGLGTAAIFEGLLHVPRTDAYLSRHGQLWQRDPDGLSLAGLKWWPAHLQWGADRLVETARHLRAGRTLAAVINTRNQLERWTLNAADSHGIEPGAGEDRQNFISRVWKQAHPDQTHDMGAAWAQLSEILHGRSRGDAVTAWSAASREWTSREVKPVPQEVTDLHDWTARVAVGVFRQVQACIATLCRQTGNEELANLMRSRFQVDEVSQHPTQFEETYFQPVDPLLAFSDWSELADIRSRLYRTEMEDLGAKGEPFDPSPHVGTAIIERRARTIDNFREAWDTERTALGDDFVPERLLGRLFRFQAIAEGADIVARWAQAPQQAALRLAAEGLRTASGMWLEDSNLALFAMRTVLEQTCRARTHRTKPSKAQKMEAKGGKAVSPSRWIHASGWNRAQVIGRALGEFSHIDFNSRWTGSRKLLEDIQGDDSISKVHTARGHALDAVAYLLAFEAIERMEEVDANLARGFREEVTLMDGDAHKEMVEDLLGRAMSLKSFDFGEPDLGPRENA